jgi:hypothetical protein
MLHKQITGASFPSSIPCNKEVSRYSPRKNSLAILRHHHTLISTPITLAFFHLDILQCGPEGQTFFKLKNSHYVSKALSIVALP